MPKKDKKQTATTKDAFKKEYEDLFETYNSKFSINQEWLNEGDFIEKYSLYGDYTPVETSNSTTLQ